MEPFEIMISESQERMLCVVEPDKLAELQEVCDRWEVRSTAIGEVTDSRRLRVLDGGEVGGRHAGRGAGGRLPAVRPGARAAGRADLPGAGAARCRRDDPADVLLALLGSPNLSSRRPLFEQYDSRRAVAHRAPSRAGRRRGAPAHPRRAGERHRRVDRRQRPPRGLRPLQGHGRGGAGVRGQPRLRRGRAARPHQLPELRQPREAARGVAARALGGGHDRRAGGARRAGGGRQRLALQRVRRRADLPHAGGRDGGLAARRRAGGADGFPERGRHDRLRGEFEPHLPG